MDSLLTRGAICVFTFAIIAHINLAQAAGYTITDLGTLGGSSSTAKDINENGQVTGESKTADDSRHAADINDRGDTTGYGEINGETHAFLAIAVSAADTDSDGVADNSDNCTLVPNPRSAIPMATVMETTVMRISMETLRWI